VTPSSELRFALIPAADVREVFAQDADTVAVLLDMLDTYEPLTHALVWIHYEVAAATYTGLVPLLPSGGDAEVFTDE